MKKEFIELYNELTNKKDNELLKIWEDSKKEKTNRKIVILVVLIIVDILVALRFSEAIRSVRDVFIVIATILFYDLIIGVIVNALIQSKTRKYNSVYKTKVVEKIIKNFFDEVDYIPEKPLPSKIYDEGKYDENYNRYYSDDYVDAKLDNKYDLKMAEVKTVYETTYTDSDGHTHTDRVTRFHGLFIKIKIDKSIKNNLTIKQNGTIRKKERLEMDSSEFEKYFDVSSNNDIIGMQILTHDVMELLLEYRKYLKCPFDICIYEDIVYIRIHCGTMFEATISSKVLIDREKTEEYYNMLEFIYKLSKEVIKMSDGDY